MLKIDLQFFGGRGGGSAGGGGGGGRASAANLFFKEMETSGVDMTGNKLNLTNDLPDLKGTQKDVAEATSIRDEKLKQLKDGYVIGNEQQIKRITNGIEVGARQLLYDNERIKNGEKPKYSGLESSENLPTPKQLTLGDRKAIPEPKAGTIKGYDPDSYDDGIRYYANMYKTAENKASAYNEYVATKTSAKYWLDNKDSNAGSKFSNIAKDYRKIYQKLGGTYE